MVTGTTVAAVPPQQGEPVKCCHEMERWVMRKSYHDA
jgi:hypothetical protein